MAQLLFPRLGSRFGLGWLRATADSLPDSVAHGSVMAIDAVIDDLYVHQGQLTAAIVQGAGATGPEEALAAWVDQRKQAVTRIERLLGEMRTIGSVDLATLVVAGNHLRALAQAPSGCRSEGTAPSAPCRLFQRRSAPCRKSNHSVLATLIRDVLYSTNNTHAGGSRLPQEQSLRPDNPYPRHPIQHEQQPRGHRTRAAANPCHNEIRDQLAASTRATSTSKNQAAPRRECRGAALNRPLIEMLPMRLPDLLAAARARFDNRNGRVGQVISR